MISHSTYQALLKDKLSLTTALENNPVFQDLQHVSKLIESYESQAGQPKKDTLAGKEPQNDDTTFNTNDEVAEASDQQWVKTGNASITISNLKESLESIGIKIKGASPGTTLGAIISQRKASYECVDEKNRLWRMRQEAFEAAKRKTADTRSAA